MPVFKILIRVVLGMIASYYAASHLQLLKHIPAHHEHPFRTNVNRILLNASLTQPLATLIPFLGIRVM